MEIEIGQFPDNPVTYTNLVIKAAEKLKCLHLVLIYGTDISETTTFACAACVVEAEVLGFSGLSLIDYFRLTVPVGTRIPYNHSIIGTLKPP